MDGLVIKEIERLRLDRSKDVLVLTLPHGPTPEDKLRIRQELDFHEATRGVRVLLKSPNIGISVLTIDEAEGDIL